MLPDRFIPARLDPSNHFAFSHTPENRNPNESVLQARTRTLYQDALFDVCSNPSRVLSHSRTSASAAHPATVFMEKEQSATRERAFASQYPKLSPKCVKVLDAPDLEPQKFASFMNLEGDTLIIALNDSVYVSSLTKNDDVIEIPEESFYGHATCVHSVAEKVFIGRDTGVFSLTDLHSQVKPLQYGSEPILSAASSSEEPTIVYFTTNDQIVRADFREMDGVSPVLRHNARITRIALDSWNMASGNENGSILVWDLRNPTTFSPFHLPTAVTSLEWASTGPHYLFAAAESRLMALDPLHSHNPVCQMDVDGVITGIATSPRSPELVLTQSGKEPLLRVCRVRDEAFECIANSTLETNPLAVCTNGTRTTVARVGQRVDIWEDVFSPRQVTKKPSYLLPLR